MATRKPLVIGADGLRQQIQGGDSLDAPAIVVTVGVTTTPGVVIKGVLNQTSNFLEIRDSTNTLLANITTSGVFTGNGSGLTSLQGSAVVGNISGNAGGITGGITESQVTNLVTDLAAKAVDTAVVHLTGNETVGGIKTFSSTIVGSVSGNSGTSTNGVVTTGSYSDPTWITAFAGSKISGDINGNASSITGVIAESQVTNLVTDLAATEKTVNKGVANGYPSLDSGGRIPIAQIPSALIGAVVYQGVWNATTNSPTLANGIGTKGNYYKVSVAGGTTIDGNTGWVAGDWIIFNGTTWDKIDNNELVTSVFGRTGTIVATTGDYTAAKVTNAVDVTSSYSDPTWITSLAASKLTGTGTLPVVTLPGGIPTGLLKGVSSAFAAAVAGTDYLTPSGNGSALTGLTNTQISGLGTASTHDIGYFLQTSNNLSDVVAGTARTNIGASQALNATGVKTSAYTAVAGDLVPVDTTSGTVPITLTTAPANKSRIAIKHIIQGGSNTVTIAAGGLDVYNKVGGGTSLTLTLLNQGVILEYNSSTAVWFVVADDLALSQLDSRYLSPTGSGAGLTNIPHSSLTGLTTGDDHTQYALLAGRSGGQVIYGGTASGNSLTLSSTSHATKGYVLLGSGGLVGVNEGTPTGQVQITSSAIGTKNLILKMAASQTANPFELQDTGGTPYITMTREGYLGINISSNLLGQLHISATGQVTYFGNTTSVLPVYAQTQNLGGRYYQGVDNASGTGLWTGGLAYASSFGTSNATALQLATNNIVRLTVSSGGLIGINETSIGAQLQVTSSAAGTKGLIIKAAASATANPFEIQNSSGTALTYVDPSGNINTSGTLTLGGGINATLSLTNTSTLNLISSTGRVRLGTANQFIVQYSVNSIASHVFDVIDKTLAVNSNAISATGQLDVNVGSTSRVGVIVKSIASQTSSLIELQDPNATVLTKFGPSGALTTYGTTTSLLALTTPVNSTFTTATTGGSLTPGTYYYRIAAVNSQGTTVASTETSIVVPAGTSTNTVIVNWGAVNGATSYKVYGRATGAELLIATVTAPTVTYVDTGAITPSGALPGAPAGTTLVAQGWGSQTGNYLECQDSGGTPRIFVSPGTVSSGLDNNYIALKPGNREYRIGTFDGGGAMYLLRGDISSGISIVPSSSNVIIATTGASGVLALYGNSISSGVVITPSLGGGAGVVQFGRRLSDSSSSVGASTEFWGCTSQTAPTICTVVPGGGTYVFKVGLNGDITTTLQSASVVGMIIKAAASQTADTFQIQNSSGTVITRVSSLGILSTENVGATGGGDSYRLYTTDTTFNRRVGFFFKENGTEGGIKADSQIALSAGGDIYLRPTGSTFGVRYSVSSNDVIFRSEHSTGSLINQANTSANVAIVGRAASSPTADILQIQKSDATVLSKFGPLGSLSVGQDTSTGTPLSLLTVTGAAHTALTASTEYSDVNFNLARTVQFSTGALTTQRVVRIQAPTYSFVGASTITDAVTLDISGSPVAGTNATITNAMALRVNTGITAGKGLVVKATSDLTATISNVALTSNVATITTSSAHGFLVGQLVKITGLTTTLLNVLLKTITSVPSTTTFTFALTTSNISSTSDSGTATVPQSGNLIDCQDSSGTSLIRVNGFGQAISAISQSNSLPTPCFGDSGGSIAIGAFSGYTGILMSSSVSFSVQRCTNSGVSVLAPPTQQGSYKQIFAATSNGLILGGEGPGNRSGYGGTGLSTEMFGLVPWVELVASSTSTTNQGGLVWIQLNSGLANVAQIDAVSDSTPPARASSLHFRTHNGTTLVDRLQISSGGNVIVNGFTSSVVGVSIKAAPSQSVDVFQAQNSSSVVLSSIDSSGNLTTQLAGVGIKIKEGSNARMGVATLVGGTVTVANTSVTTTTRIILTHQNGAGTVGAPYISARINATSFTITSINPLDTSDIAWLLFEPS